MDGTRGGYFEDIPNRYPANSWYHYDDDECEYSCMITEYIYWSITSLLGAQKNRLEDIQDEWELNTSSKMQKDKKFIIIQNIIFLPTFLNFNFIDQILLNQQLFQQS